MPLFVKAGVPIGDPAVDNRFSIHSVPTGFAIQLFRSTNLQQGILLARSFYLELTSTALRFENLGIEKDVDHQVWLLRLLCEVVSFIENR